MCYACKLVISLQQFSWQNFWQINKIDNSIEDNQFSKTMPLTDSETQCSKLFTHLNYCLQILKKNLDQQKLQILKRVEHDIDIIQKYIKSLMKYNDKRENQFEKLIKQLKNKQQQLELQNKQLEILNKQLQIQNSQILQLSCRITKKQQEINKKQQIIEHLKYSKKIDASYVSSILFNENSSMMKELYKDGKVEPRYAEGNSIDGLSLSEYSEQGAGEEKQKIQTQNTLTTTKSEIKVHRGKSSQSYFGVINEEEKNMEQKGLDKSGEKQVHKASSLIFGE